MIRRIYFNTTPSFHWIAALFLCAFLGNARAAERPNIIFLLSDDHRWDMMSCAGNKIIQTPEMYALARDGVRFKNAFVTTPICAASRASIFTGLHERTHRYTFGTKPLTDEHVRMSYPAALKRAGYRTGFVGKFGVGVEGGATDAMFDSFVKVDRNPYFKKMPDGSERHATEIEGDRAIEFLETVKDGQPFCLSVSFNAPHAEDNDPRQYFWTKESDSLYRNAKFPVPSTMTDEFFNQHPDFLKNSESRKRFGWRFDEPQKYQDMVRGYYRMITDVDRVIGRIRDALKERGLDENTIIIFTGDNGYFLGDRGFADKWYIYEKSIRVPLIVFDPRAPKSQRGKTAEAMALNIDLAPTMLTLAGADVSETVQGRSLIPLLNGKKPKDWRTDLFFEHLMEADGAKFGRTRIPKSEGVRGERFSYVRWFESDPLVEELYDHTRDFEQEHNLIANPKFAKTAAELRKRTTELRDLYGGPFVSNFAPRAERKASKDAKSSNE
ncbi:MAG: sulfatase [Verrucomicrobia bacterium]|nr:sulfatase [Verrucomicrobiota bacterium]